jgi:hypothetical protein
VTKAAKLSSLIYGVAHKTQAIMQGSFRIGSGARSIAATNAEHKPNTDCQNNNFSDTTPF